MILSEEKIKVLDKEISLEYLIDKIIEHQVKQDKAHKEALGKVKMVLDAVKKMQVDVTKTRPDLSKNLKEVVSAVNSITEGITSIPSPEIDLTMIRDELRKLNPKGIENEIKNLSKTIDQRKEEEWDFTIVRDGSGRIHSVKAKPIIN